MSTDPLAIRPVECQLSATRWRGLAERTAALTRAADDRCRALMLDQWASGVRWPGEAIVDELGRAADLLDATVRAVELVGFDVTATALAGRLHASVTDLRAVLTDDRGARLVDLDDPSPDRRAVTAHFGYLPLFAAGGPRPGDVNQGSLGDCWMFAAIAAIADARPEQLERMFVDHGDGTYTVTIEGAAVIVDDEFPVGDDGVPIYARGPRRTEPAVLWPLLLEKALAARAGGYDELSGGDASLAFDLVGESDGMSLSQIGWFDPSDDEVFEVLDRALDDGTAVGATASGLFGMGGRHAWTVVDTGTGTGGEPTVTVRNPWGRSGFEVSDGAIVRTTKERVQTDLDPDEVVIDEDRAEVTLPLDEFVEHFDELDIVTEWDD